jgi:hypothetical protein
VKSTPNFSSRSIDFHEAAGKKQTCWINRSFADDQHGAADQAVADRSSTTERSAAEKREGGWRVAHDHDNTHQNPNPNHHHHR